MSHRDEGESPRSSRSVIEQEYVRRAFELAYFLHPNVGIALRVTAAALCKLDHTFGKQDRRFHYVPGGRRHSRGRPAYAQRTKVSLKKEHLLQLLVYVESDSWERSNEHEDSPIPVTNEDLVIRFVKHLVQITLKRNSFYVALGVGRLIYDYETSQVSQMYDILMQDDARFRDNAYLRKQKKVLMMEMIERFDQMIRMVRTVQMEYRFVPQPTTEPLISLVKECLNRFTPWDTSCEIPTGFDPTEKIAALSFSKSDTDQESPTEMNRIHTILDPSCFSRLVASLGLESPDMRLAIPQFFISPNDEPCGNRFNPPPLTSEDQLKLQRAREDSKRRRKAYRVGQLRIYIDEVERFVFDPRCAAKVKFKFRPEADVIEVRGQDSEGELRLGTLLVSYDNIPPGQSLTDSVALEGGQRLTIGLTPIRNASGEVEEIGVEMWYCETQAIQTISWLAQRTWFRLVGLARGPDRSEQSQPGYRWPVKVGLTVALFLSSAMIIAIVWRQLQSSKPKLPVAPHQVELAPVPLTESSPSAASSPVPAGPRTEKGPSSLIARATWDNNPNALDNAIRLELRRGGVPSVEIPAKPSTQLIALNRADAEDRPYQRYRVLVLAEEKPIWQTTLQTPQGKSSGRAHVLNLELSPKRFPKSDSYRLRVEGETQNGWQSIGVITLQVVNR